LGGSFEKAAVMGGFELRRREHANLAVEAAVVEEVDVVEGGELHIVQPGPGAVLVDEFGLEEAVEGFGQGVVIAVAAGTHGGDRTGLCEALGVADGQVLPRSLWWIRPSRLSPRRAHIAISRASRARSVRSDLDTCQPTMRLEKTSITKAT